MKIIDHNIKRRPLWITRQQTKKTGTPNGKFWEKGLKPTTTWYKAFWSYFKHFRRLLGKCICSSTPSKTDRRVPSQQGAPTTYNLTYWEVSQQTYVQILLASLGVAYGQNLDLQWWEGDGWGRFLTHIIHRRYSRHQVPSDTLNYLFPSNTFLPRTDILRNRS